MIQADAPKVIVMGSGTSTGVPIIGCSCPVCVSTDLRDNRLRTGVQISYQGFSLLIDLTPDFRQQVFRYGIKRVDAVLLTHPHADHILGIDELRQFNSIQSENIPVYARDFTMDGLGKMFSYVVHPPKNQANLHRPRIDCHTISSESVQIGPFHVSSRVVPHGPACSTAYALETGGHRLVYLSDCSEISTELLDFMSGADVILIDALRDRPHPSHITINTAVEAILTACVPRGYLIHLSHDRLHADLESKLPLHIRPAYDGLEFSW